MIDLTIKEILRGTTPGKIQTVGIMQVIPLISEIEDIRFVSPSMEGKIGTVSYGTMQFENDSNKIMIIPNHAAYLVKHAAQNHGMMHAGIVPAKNVKRYDTAACIQQSQGGYIPTDKHPLTILPFALREHALSLRSEHSYSKLWPAIAEFNKRCGLSNTGGHLEKFYDHFDKELEEFAAEFEIVPKQVGAIVLIMGKVVGIDRAPSYEYWNSIWRGLIRGCYGSLSIQFEKENKITPEDIKNIRIPIKTNVSTLDDLEAELDKAESVQDEIAKKCVRDLIDEKFKVESDERVKPYDRMTISNKQFVGQIIMDTDVESIVYSSLITKNKWFEKQNWFTSKAFDI